MNRQPGQGQDHDQDYLELYEAVYLAHALQNKDIDLDLMHTSAYQALMRILVANDLYTEKEGEFLQGKQQRLAYDAVVATVKRQCLEPSQDAYFHSLLEKVIRGNQFFFSNLSDDEYTIYSKCDFPITHGTGLEVAKHLDLSNLEVLELGGNSGGLAWALVDQNPTCHYTVVDQPIPCGVGRVLCKGARVPIDFVVADIFDLDLPAKGPYDGIILMNLLHDFDDGQCRRILENCLAYAHDYTYFIVIEDTLRSNFEPRARLMQGLRLAIECRGARQRTGPEMDGLFSSIGFRQETYLDLTTMQSMLIYSKI